MRRPWPGYLRDPPAAMMKKTGRESTFDSQTKNPTPLSSRSVWPISLSGSDPAGFGLPSPLSGLAGDVSQLPSPRSASLESVFGADPSGSESPSPETGPASDESQPPSPIWRNEVNSTDESFVCSTVPPNPNSFCSPAARDPWGDTFVPCTFQDLVPSIGDNSSAEKCDGELAESLPQAILRRRGGQMSSSQTRMMEVVIWPKI